MTVTVHLMTSLKSCFVTYVQANKVKVGLFLFLGGSLATLPAEYRWKTFASLRSFRENFRPKGGLNVRHFTTLCFSCMRLDVLADSVL